MSSLADNGNIIIRTIVPQVSAITSRKGNPISRRTLRFLLVCKVIGSPSRSRFAREFNILQIRAGNITPGETRFCNYKMPGAPLFGRPASATFLSSIYVSIPLSSRFPVADLSTATTFTPAGRTSKLPCIYAARFSCQWRRLRGTYGKINLVSTVDR